MNRTPFFPLVFASLYMLTTFLTGADRQEIRLALTPSLSPNGSRLAFSWRGDIWVVPTKGGNARQLTQHTAKDSSPVFSPDGSEIAFVSNRNPGNQVYIMSSKGGQPRQLTHHTEGYQLEQWCPSGDELLVKAGRDHSWKDPERFFKISCKERRAPELIFDSYCSDGNLSPDGNKILFTREGTKWWRKGYRGSTASQIWLYDLQANKYIKLLHDETCSLYPLWKPEGTGFYYVGAQSGSFNLWEYDLKTGKKKQLTEFKDDSVLSPCISRDGSTIVFRHLFDLYRFRPVKDKKPVRIRIRNSGDSIKSPVERIILEQATDIAFSSDGLEIAFISGGDLWVMDTELREPHRVTDTPEQERNPVFSPDKNTIFFSSDQKGQCDIWRAERSDKELFWWQNLKFELTCLTHDADVESEIQFSPDGSCISYIKGPGDLWIMKPDGKDARRILKCWNPPDYDWSPDSRWIVYCADDNDFNRDVWIIPSNGSGKPVNISRHPYDDHNPVWRPDGKVIAFTSERHDRERDIYYVWLEKQESEKNSRDRKLEKALNKMSEAMKKDKENKGIKTNKATDKKTEKVRKPEVVIDFDRIHERLRRVHITGSSERKLFWSHDSGKLAFTAEINGKKGTYTINIPDQMTPVLLTNETGSQSRWLKKDNRIVWSSRGRPASVSATGKQTVYIFNAKQTVNSKAHFKTGFDLAWRKMRDGYYDEHLGNRNWDAIRRKYTAAAANAPDIDSFSLVVNLMLGELNGSHLGFTPQRKKSNSAVKTWPLTTGHPGIRFEQNYKGPGLKIKDVLPNGPADQQKSRLLPGEIILSINGTTVDPAMDLTEIMNGSPDRNILLSVKAKDNKTREVILRPISYSKARDLLYEKWIRDNRKITDQASEKTLGYIHIRGMNWPSFQKMERELYSVGSGRDGLIIDVRNNGGGFTADHLLTILCQPVHAVTVPRNGGAGYPEDRKVYATWNKPIVVLCNQKSFSNAEIFSHAIKALKRGQLVGVPTGGGVISTGGTNIMDLGFLRMPFRGWYVAETGEDMELNGAVPDHVLWNKPGDSAKGRDAQLAKAINVLLQDVKTQESKPKPKLLKASKR